MSLWLIAAAMTVAVLAVLLTPMLRRPAAGPGPRRSAYDLAVYRDQLAEVDRDLERGVLSVAEAEAARLEMSRRMLAAADAAAPEEAGRPASRAARLGVVAAVAVLVPVGALGIYLTLGSPGMPDQPFAAREHGDGDRMGALVDALARRMAEQPDNPEGWQLLARSHRSLGRYAEAAEAYRQSIARGANDNENLVGYGEMLTLANDGEIGEPARAAFAAAYRRDRKDVTAHYYLGLAVLQEGDSRQALAIWRDLERNSPADAPWRESLISRIELLAGELGIDPASIEPMPPSAN